MDLESDLRRDPKRTRREGEKVLPMDSNETRGKMYINVIEECDTKGKESEPK